MPKPKSRGNGQGSVYKVGKKWCAEIRRRRPAFRIRKSGFATKTEALKWIAAFDIDAEIGTRKRQTNSVMTFADVFNEWLPTHQRTDNTIKSYRAAFAYFHDIHDLPFGSITIDDLQSCVDDCPRRRQTKGNMRTLASLMYKYAIPRHITDDAINFAEYIKIYESLSPRGVALPLSLLPKIKKAIGTVPFAEHILALCFTGFRAAAFLALRVEDYNRSEQAVVGGSKTEAGKRRIVTLAPEIQDIFELAVGQRKIGYIFCNPDGSMIDYKEFLSHFYDALDALGVDNPVIDGRHLYTIHSCRHTFATLLKGAPGIAKDKLELMGHTSVGMLSYYQEADYAALRSITDSLNCGQ